MVSPIEIERVNARVTEASASMEARFTDMGERLGEAVDTIAALTHTFDRLSEELAGENLRNATRQLSDIMSAIAGLANIRDDKQALFQQITGLIAAIQQRITQMRKAVDSIGMLAINTRIEAANIGDTGLDFAAFTKEIGRTLRLAQASLGQFTGELANVAQHLHLAASSQQALSHQQAEAIRSVPARLGESIDVISGRGRRAAAAAAAVTQKSREVGQAISDAVMALQIGDITRQRLEHIEQGLRIIAAIVAPGGDVTCGDWSALSESQRPALASLCGRLLSGHLLDAADEFDREVQRILSAVRDLAADAEDILQLGNAAAGATNDHRGTFLGKVEDQVAEVEAVLQGARTARQEADAVVLTVSEATTRLVGQTTDLRSLEEDIRIMGLNMTLKCGRLGPVGLPLMVIAQELRAYSNQIATEAAAVTVSLNAMVTVAGSLSNGDTTTEAARGATGAAVMTDTVTRLKAAGETLADALTTLAGHTETVAASLRQTVDRATAHEELATALRDAATELRHATACADGEAVVGTPDADRMLALIMANYTMERERIVHERDMHGRAVNPAPPAAPKAPSEAAPADYEDVFF